MRIQGDECGSKYLVAVSGGVDSAVLLDMLVSEGNNNIVVAHFDHGIRDDSQDDCRFVKALAENYGVPFVSKRENLGDKAGENLARIRRYSFLKSEAKKRNAQIVTAHHVDDVIETIVINLVRGTGWRGIAAMDNIGVYRPLIRKTKKEIYDYAIERKLEWVEDSTNRETHYLRNRIRHVLGRVLDDKSKKDLLKIWENQLIVKNVIDIEIEKFINDDNEYSRYFFTQIDVSTACECIKAIIKIVDTKEGPTRPQAMGALIAIRTAKAGTVHKVCKDIQIKFNLRTFIVEKA